MSDSVKCTYIICSLIGDFAVFVFAAVAPLYGVHWGWSALAVVMLIGSSMAFTDRMNQWSGSGR